MPLTGAFQDLALQIHNQNIAVCDDARRDGARYKNPIGLRYSHANVPERNRELGSIEDFVCRNQIIG